MSPFVLQEIELHRLDLRYAHTRILSPDSLGSLCASLERFGQITPLVSVESLTLIDGYRRVAALKRNRKDTALVEIWPVSEQEALLRVLARPRRWEAVEEAALLREILEGSTLSRAHLARRLGKDPSWVSRRLDLLESLSEEMLALIRSGHLSSWAASRVIVPLARANEAHALSLASQGISSRDLAAWFAHYQKANRATREKMVHDPALFVKVLRARADERQVHHLREGPEGRWLHELETLTKILRQRRKDIPVLCGIDLGPIQHALQTIKASLHALIEQIERIASHGVPANATNDCEPPPGAHPHSADQHDLQDLEKHGSSRPAGETPSLISAQP